MTLRLKTWKIVIFKTFDILIEQFNGYSNLNQFYIRAMTYGLKILANGFCLFLSSNILLTVQWIEYILLN